MVGDQTYSLVAVARDTGDMAKPTTWIFRAPANENLTAGDTVTITVPSETPTALAALWVSPADNTTVTVDRTATATGIATPGEFALAVGPTSTLTQTGEVVLVAFGVRTEDTDTVMPERGRLLPVAGTNEGDGDDLTLYVWVYGTAETTAVTPTGLLRSAANRRYSGVVATCMPSSPNTTEVYFAKPFNTRPAVTVAIADGQAGDVVRMEHVQPEWFRLRVLNGGSPVYRSFDWIAQAD